MRKKNLFEKYANTHNGRVKLEELAKIFHTEVMSTNLLWVGSNLFVMCGGKHYILYKMSKERDIKASKILIIPIDVDIMDVYNLIKGAKEYYENK